LKLNRNFQKTSKEIAPFIDIASNSSTDGRPLANILMEVEGTIRAAWTLPEDERRKIIKRLYKKWHPDKNFGNELVTTEVFKFIKQAVLNHAARIVPSTSIKIFANGLPSVLELLAMSIKGAISFEVF
jgi:hypothetical protein